MLRKLMLTAAAAALAFSAALTMAQDDETFALTILHTNDTHAAHEPGSNGDGGAAIQRAVVEQIRAEGGSTVLVDGGDRFTGTLFHQVHRGQDSVQIMNLLGYDAMTLGNHEFDNGDEVLAAFVDGLNFPVVTANVDFSASDILAGKILPWAIIDVGGEQIGVIGLVTPDTPSISSPGDDLVFNDDLAGVTQSAVDELTAAGVNKVILVTHIGLQNDIDLAAQVTGVDVIVGGHSHSLLSNAYVASVGEYPVEAAGADGAPVVIVQAGERTTYLGRLDVEFDAEGVLASWDGDTILLSRYITPDEEMAGLVAELAAPIEELRATSIGAETADLLVGNRAVCRVEECPLGNLITDALRAETGAQIAITNGGGIRADIDAGDITVGDVLTVLPFGNTTATMELTGADVIAALENGVSAVTVADGMVVRDGASGRFPQVSGIRFTFDPTQDAGSRITSVEVEGEDGTFAPIDEAATYTVATNNFMRQGGDSYTVFAENAVNPYDFGRPLDEVLADYLAANTPVVVEMEGRITVEGAELPPME